MKIKIFLAFKLCDVVFNLLIIVKMPTIVGILTIYEQDKNFMLSWDSLASLEINKIDWMGLCLVYISIYTYFYSVHGKLILHPYISSTLVFITDTFLKFKTRKLFNS